MTRRVVLANHANVVGREHDVDRSRKLATSGVTLVRLSLCVDDDAACSQYRCNRQDQTFHVPSPRKTESGAPTGKRRSSQNVWGKTLTFIDLQSAEEPARSPGFFPKRRNERKKRYLPIRKMRATTATVAVARRHPLTGTRRQGWLWGSNVPGRTSPRYPVETVFGRFFGPDGSLSARRGIIGDAT